MRIFGKRSRRRQEGEEPSSRGRSYFLKSLFIPKRYTKQTFSSRVTIIIPLASITQEIHVMILSRSISASFFSSFSSFFPPFIRSTVSSNGIYRVSHNFQLSVTNPLTVFFLFSFYNQLYVKIMHICKSVLKYYNLIFYSRLLSASS